MNKEKIVKELDDYVKNIDSSFSVSKGLNLYVDDYNIAFFVNFKIKKFVVDTMEVNYDAVIKAMKFDIIKKFYDKAIELLKQNEKKYTINILNDDLGYLNLDTQDNSYVVDDNVHAKGYKVTFTKSEIDELKQQSDLAIDWDKAIIEEVVEE